MKLRLTMNLNLTNLVRYIKLNTGGIVYSKGALATSSALILALAGFGCGGTGVPNPPDPQAVRDRTAEVHVQLSAFDSAVQALLLPPSPSAIAPATPRLELELCLHSVGLKNASTFLLPIGKGIDVKNTGTRVGSGLVPAATYSASTLNIENNEDPALCPKGVAMYMRNDYGPYYVSAEGAENGRIELYFPGDLTLLAEETYSMTMVIKELVLRLMRVSSPSMLRQVLTQFSDPKNPNGRSFVISQRQPN